MLFSHLSGNVSNDQAFEERDQFEVDLNEGAKSDGFIGYTDGIFDFVRPNVLNALCMDQ
jgi:hypothetical protein